MGPDGDGFLDLAATAQTNFGGAVFRMVVSSNILDSAKKSNSDVQMVASSNLGFFSDLGALRETRLLNPWGQTSNTSILSAQELSVMLSKDTLSNILYYWATRHYMEVMLYLPMLFIPSYLWIR